MVLVGNIPKTKKLRKVLGKIAAQRSLEELAQKHTISRQQFEKDIGAVVEVVYINDITVDTSAFVLQLQRYGKTLEQITNYFEHIFKTDLAADRYRGKCLKRVKAKYRSGFKVPIPINEREERIYRGLLQAVQLAKKNHHHTHTNSELETERYSTLAEDGDEKKAFKRVLGSVKDLQTYIWDMAFGSNGKANPECEKHIMACNHCSQYRFLLFYLETVSRPFSRSSQITKSVSMYHG